MAKVTSKYQVTLPRAIAEKYKIRPGDDIDLFHKTCLRFWKLVHVFKI